MIFSAFATLLLLGVLIYALLQGKQFPFLARTLPFVCAGGIYIVWVPERTVQIAQFVGIGRGSDLVLYVWVLISGLLILGLHLKLVTQSRKMTDIARYIAIAGARRPKE